MDVLSYNLILIIITSYYVQHLTTCFFRLRSHNKRPHRVDVTKIPPTDNDNGIPSKVSRNNASPAIIRGELDPNSSDHVVAMTQLKEKIASLQKQLSMKDAQLLNKDKMVVK
jgi:hypothetical protein